MKRYLAFLAFCFLAAVVLFAGGCSDGRPHRYFVKGTVEVDGQALSGNPECIIRFIPQDGSRPATGKIGADGSFTLTTYEKDDGCPKGKYTVIIIATRTEAGKMYYLVPPRYSEKDKTDLEAEITGRTDDLILNVQWTSADKAYKKPINLGDMGA